MGWNTTYATTPIFVADWNSVGRNTGRQIDWSLVPDSYKAGVSHTITAPDGAAQSATEIVVEALTVALPTGTVLRFGAGEFAELTAPAAVGDEELAVAALVNAIESDDAATYLISESHDKVIKAGTVMCQIAATGKIVPRVNRPGSEEAIGLLMTTAIENSRVDSLSGHGVIVGGVIYENLLPETITSYKTELETNGLSWVWQTYADNREV